MIKFLLAAGHLYTCSLTGFPNMPESVTGKSIIEFKEWITIGIENEKGSDRLELTIKKERCTKNE